MQDTLPCVCAKLEKVRYKDVDMTGLNDTKIYFTDPFRMPRSLTHIKEY